MKSPHSTRGRVILIVVGVVVVLVIGGLAGGALTGALLSGGRGTGVQLGSEAAMSSRSSGQDYAATAPTAPDAPAAGVAEDAAAQKSATVAPDQMLVKTATMEVRVDDVSSAIDTIRSTATRFEAQISDYSLQHGDSYRPVEPLSKSTAPSSAYVTIRVPAKSLDALRREMAKIGDVLTESSAASDVTQQYVDMDARLKNLKAEESRLREFLTKTDKVSELLSVESELSRVRGEIESMQAQLDYLSKQVELSTLTINLTEPGAVVRPEGIDWGFREALTRGFQGAAALLTFLISASIALTPLALIAAIVFVVIRGILRRRTHARPTPEPGGTEHSEDQAA